MSPLPVLRLAVVPSRRGNLMSTHRNVRLVLSLGLVFLGGCGTDRVGRSAIAADQLYDYICSECPSAIGRTTAAECNAAPRIAML